MTETKFHNFNNIGFFWITLPQELIKSLRREMKTIENHEQMKSNITYIGVPKHYHITENRDKLEKFLKNEFVKQKNNYPVKLDRCWAGIQKKNEFVPYHIHQGAFAFTIWLELFEEKHKYCSNFQFLYIDVLGDIQAHTIELDKSHEGKMLLFPANLGHIVYPHFNEKNRVSISGNLK